MQGFLDRLVSVAKSSPLLDPEQVARLAKELQDEYLVARVYGETTDDEDHDEVALRHRTLRDAALFFEMMLLGADDTSQEYIQDALEVAATVFEFLSRATPERVFRDWVEQEGFVECLLSGPLNDLLRAGLLYSLAGKPANGYLLLQRLVKTAERLLESCNQEELGEARLATWVIGCLGYLMAARREDLDEATRLSFMVEDLASDLGASGTIRVFQLVGRTALEVLRASLSRQAGHDVQELVRQAQKAARSTGNPGLQWFAFATGRVMVDLLNTSVRVVLREHGFPPDYIDLLVDTGTTRLWPSQLRALHRGILGGTTEHFVVGLPTGAGKSLLAELLVAKCLLRNKNAWCVYLAPSRALVRQVERDLRVRLPWMGIAVRNVVAGAEQGDSLGAEVRLLTQQTSVTILTPEKLDIYMRFSPEVFETCALCIVDEAHLIGAGERGLRLETLLSILYSGPRKLDTKKAIDKLQSNHEKETLTRP